jgi:hypothetical protein
MKATQRMIFYDDGLRITPYQKQTWGRWSGNFEFPSRNLELGNGDIRRFIVKLINNL